MRVRSCYLDFITRAQWNARPPRWGYATIAWSSRPGLETHHSVGSASSPQAWFRDVQAFHQGTKGWNDIFYNVGVWFDGRIIEGRPFHAKSGEINHLTVVFPGNYENIKLTDAQKRSWHEVRAFARSRGAGASVAWHRQRDATACPGNNVVAWLQAGFPSPGGTTGGDDDLAILSEDDQKWLKWLVAKAGGDGGSAGVEIRQSGTLVQAIKAAMGANTFNGAGTRVGKATLEVEAGSGTSTTTDHDHDGTYAKINHPHDAETTVA